MSNSVVVTDDSFVLDDEVMGMRISGGEKERKRGNCYTNNYVKLL